MNHILCECQEARALRLMHTLQLLQDLYGCQWILGSYGLSGGGLTPFLDTQDGLVLKRSTGAISKWSPHPRENLRSKNNISQEVMCIWFSFCPHFSYRCTQVVHKWWKSKNEKKIEWGHPNVLHVALLACWYLAGIVFARVKGSVCRI